MGWDESWAEGWMPGGPRHGRGLFSSGPNTVSNLKSSRNFEHFLMQFLCSIFLCALRFPHKLGEGRMDV
jgi:hypothetical protein